MYDGPWCCFGASSGVPVYMLDLQVGWQPKHSRSFTIWIMSLSNSVIWSFLRWRDTILIRTWLWHEPGSGYIAFCFFAIGSLSEAPAVLRALAVKSVFLRGWLDGMSIFCGFRVLGANGIPFNSVGPVFFLSVWNKAQVWRHGLQIVVHTSLFMLFLGTRWNFRLIHRSMRVRNQRWAWTKRSNCQINPNI